MFGMFKKKNINRDVTTEEKIQDARNRIGIAFSMFSDINDEIDDINKMLGQTIVEDSVKIEALNKNIDDAKTELEMNQKLKENISVFLVGEKDE